MHDYKLPVMKGKYVAPRESRKAATSRLSAHLKYNEYRTYGPDETRADRSLFDAEQEQIQRRDAVTDIMEHGSSSVRYHKIVLSPADYEHVEDFRAWTREIMADLEERKGIYLHWYAVQHHNTDHPHVHVVLAGAGEDAQTGERKTVRMTYDQDYAFMRQSGREHSNFEFYHQIEQTLQEMDHADDTTRTSPDLEHQYGGIER